MKAIPTHSKDLIEQLDRDEPELVITPKLTDKEIMYRAGRRTFIIELKTRLKATEEGNVDDPEIK